MPWHWEEQLSLPGWFLDWGCWAGLWEHPWPPHVWWKLCTSSPGWLSPWRSKSPGLDCSVAGLCTWMGISSCKVWELMQVSLTHRSCKQRGLGVLRVMVGGWTTSCFNLWSVLPFSASNCWAIPSSEKCFIYLLLWTYNVPWCIIVKKCFICLKFCWQMSLCFHEGLHFKAIALCKEHLCELWCHPASSEWAPSSLLLLLPALQRTILCRFWFPHPQLFKLWGGRSVQVLWAELAGFSLFLLPVSKKCLQEAARHTLVGLFPYKWWQGHSGVALERWRRWGAAGRCFRDRSLSWAWSVLGHILEKVPWKGLPWLPHLVPLGLGKSQVLPSQWVVEVKFWSCRVPNSGPDPVWFCLWFWFFLWFWLFLWFWFLFFLWLWFFLWFWFLCSSQCCDTRLQPSAAAQKCWLIPGLLARGLRQTWNH